MFTHRKGAMALLTVAALALAGCTSSPPAETPETPSSGPESPANLSLTVGTIFASTDYANIYSAAALGYYEDAGVDVTIQEVGANYLNLLTSGALDLAGSGTGASLAPVSNGMQTTIVYNTVGAGEGATLAVLADSPYRTVADLAGKRVAVIGSGGAAYGWGNIYSSIAENEVGQAIEVISTTTPAIQLNGVLSGQFEALVTTGGFIASLVEDGTLRLIADPTTPRFKTIVGDDLANEYPEFALYGMKDNLDEKREAVERFLAAITRADNYLKLASAEDIAKTLASHPSFQGQTVDGLTYGALETKPFYAPTNGFITSETWAQALRNIKHWRVQGVDVDDPMYAFSNMIDMSYLENAVKLVSNDQ